MRINYPVKSINNSLKLFEYGGSTLAVFYANFASNNNWMAKEDFHCETDEELKSSIESIRQMYDDYNLLRKVRFEFMDSHEKISNGV